MDPAQKTNEVMIAFEAMTAEKEAARIPYSAAKTQLEAATGELTENAPPLRAALKTLREPVPRRLANRKTVVVQNQLQW